MDTETLDSLQKADWPFILQRLLRYTFFLAGKRKLPAGYEAEDIVEVAVFKVFTEERPWQRERCSLLGHLRGSVRSIMSEKGLFGLKSQKAMVFTDDESILDFFKQTVESDYVGEDPQQAWSCLMQAVAGDKELEDLVAAIQMVGWKTAQIAEMTGWPSNKISKLKSRLWDFEDKARTLFEENRVMKDVK